MVNTAVAIATNLGGRKRYNYYTHENRAHDVSYNYHMTTTMSKAQTVADCQRQWSSKESMRSAETFFGHDFQSSAMDLLATCHLLAVGYCNQTKQEKASLIPRPTLFFVLRFALTIIHGSRRAAKKGASLGELHMSDVRWTQGGHTGHGAHSQFSRSLISSSSSRLGLSASQLVETRSC